MKQVFFLQEVIDDLVNLDKSLAASLFKLNYFGKLIKNQELIEYTHNELNGYKGGREKIPAYRKTPATLKISMQAYMNRHGGQLPVSMVDEQYRYLFDSVYITQGITSIENLAKHSGEDDSSGEIVVPVEMELLHMLQVPARKLYKSDVRIDVIGAELTCSPSVVIEIPNAIRVKLLDFVMSIAETFGYNIEIESFNKKAETNNQIIIHQMSTNINNSGDGNVINTGNNNQITNEVTLYKNDIERLQKELRQQGVDEEDIREISDIVATEVPNADEGRLGVKANGWISTVINKSLNGIGKISTGLTVHMLATFIKHYYGIA
jgi:hypothetical protein